MARKKSCLDNLIAQRQILLAESDLNRIHFFQELGAFKIEIQRAAQPAKKIASIFSVAAKAGVLFSFINHFRRGKTETENARRPGNSVFKNVFTGLKTGFSIWRLLRTRRH